MSEVEMTKQKLNVTDEWGTSEEAVPWSTRGLLHLKPHNPTLGFAMTIRM